MGAVSRSSGSRENLGFAKGLGDEPTTTGVSYMLEDRWLVEPKGCGGGGFIYRPSWKMKHQRNLLLISQ